MRAGDVLFFRIGGTISHVGIYLDRRQFVHAPASGRSVEVENLDAPFYRKAFAGAARPVSESSVMSPVGVM
jgi:cell wall-associated NlpC family hydrolase